MSTHSRFTQLATFTALSAAATLLLSACAGSTTGQPDAMAALAPASGSTVTGHVAFTQVAGALHLDVSVAGLTPGVHGFHIHEVGDCSAPDATSAKGHFNPDAHQHGNPSGDMHHAGDMPSLTADANGKVTASFDIKGVTLDAGATSIINRALVIHADPDDYKSQPAGNAGKRVACGVIKAG
jgi:Cu-Zn family superoxide dismutase